MFKKVNLTSSNLSEEKLAELRRILPEAFSEEKIDWDKLRAVLGDDVDAGVEKFGFTWAGKSNAIKNVLIPSKATLTPAPDESVRFDESENLFIEGDNLEVLKLLKKAYFEKVKMIYIDPPYNTGGDFVYKDNFASPVKNYLEQTGQIDSEGNKLSTNKETNGRYHSDWLSMMYPRLKLAWNLLRDDGVIFVSIDDNEAHHLRMVLDEIFGEENFVNSLVWEYDNSTIKNPTGKLAKKHEYILIYSKTSNYKKDWQKIRFGDVSEDLLKRFGKYADEDGNIRLKDVKHEHSYLERILPRFRKENGRDAEDEDIIDTLESNYLRDTVNIPTTRSLDFYRKYKLWFSNPKPVSLLKLLLSLLKTEDGDLVLDFFAGSGTLARAVGELFIEGKKLRYILIQLPESIDINSDKKNKDKLEKTVDLLNEKGLAPTLSCLSKTRLKQDIKELKLDGFKVFKLAESNYPENTFEFDPEQSESENQKAFEEYLDRAKQNKLIDDVDEVSVIYENIVKEGFSLNSSIAEGVKGDNKIYTITDGDKQFSICLDRDIKDSTVKNLMEWAKDTTFICFDNALGDSAKANLGLNLELKTI